MVFLLIRSGARHLADEEVNLLGYMYTRCATPESEADMKMLQPLNGRRNLGILGLNKAETTRSPPPDLGIITLQSIVLYLDCESVRSLRPHLGNSANDHGAFEHAVLPRIHLLPKVQ
jgi:hypothetical protein